MGGECADVGGVCADVGGVQMWGVCADVGVCVCADVCEVGQDSYMGRGWRGGGRHLLICRETAFACGRW